MNVIRIILILTVLPFFAHSQCKDIKWPDDPDLRLKTESNLALYTDFMKENKYREARKPHAWMIANVPEFNESLYINGIKIYNELLENEKSESEQKTEFDSLMILYDMRVAKCGDNSQLLARKAYDAYRHTVRDTDRLDDNLKLFDEAFKAYGNELPQYMLLPYMNLAKYNFKPAANITEDDFTMYFERIQDILNNEAKTNSREDIDKIKNAIDDVYFGTILGGDPISCEYIIEKLGPRYRANPDDMNLAKQIFGLMLKNKCTDDPLWLEAGEQIVGESPEYGLVKVLGQKALQSGDIDKASKMYRQAAELADNPEDKSEILFLQGNIEEKKGNLTGARQLYLQAAAAGPSAKEAYNAIGFLYYNSFERCQQKENRVTDRLPFIAAYNMFAKAGNTDMAGKAKEQFPSKEEIFEQNYVVGDTKHVGCWIQEDVKLQTRD